MAEQQKAACVLEQLEKELEGEEEKEEAEGPPPLSASHEPTGEGEKVGEEEECHKVMEAKLLDEEDSTLQQVALSCSPG